MAIRAYEVLMLAVVALSTPTRRNRSHLTHAPERLGVRRTREVLEDALLAAS